MYRIFEYIVFPIVLILTMLRATLKVIAYCRSDEAIELSTSRLQHWYKHNPATQDEMPWANER